MKQSQMANTSSEQMLITGSIDVEKQIIDYFGSDLVSLCRLSRVSKIHRELCLGACNGIVKILGDFISGSDSIKLSEYKKNHDCLLRDLCVHDLKSGSLIVVRWILKYKECPKFYETYFLGQSAMVSMVPFEICFKKTYKYDVLESFFQFSGLGKYLTEELSKKQQNVIISTMNEYFHFLFMTSKIPFVCLGSNRELIARNNEYLKFDVLKDSIKKACQRKNSAVITLLKAVVHPDERQKMDNLLAENEL